MKDRLIELIMKSRAPLISRAIAEKEAEHLLSHGVIVPPCKVGDIVYVITTKQPCYACKLCDDECHRECRFTDKAKLVVKKTSVRTIQIGEVNKIHLKIDISKNCYAYEYTVWFDDFGKTVFLTREEAEKALKERSKENDR